MAKLHYVSVMSLDGSTQCLRTNTGPEDRGFDNAELPSTTNKIFHLFTMR